MPTSARWEVANSPKISVKTVQFAGTIRCPQASFEAQPRIARLLAPKIGIDPYSRRREPWGQMLFSKIRLNLFHPRHLVNGEGTAAVAVAALQAVRGGLFERQIVLLRQHVAQPGQVIIFVDEADIQPRRTGMTVLTIHARALRVLRREGGNDGIVPLLRFQVKQIAQNAVKSPISSRQCMKPKPTF